MAKEPFAARLTSIWLGGVFFWLLKGFKGSYKEQISEKYEQRNMWTGYLLMILSLIPIVYFGFIKR
jgi:hypothetical protein